jgi:hypothetical protein
MMNHNYLRTTFDDKIGVSFQKLEILESWAPDVLVSLNTHST